MVRAHSSWFFYFTNAGEARCPSGAGRVRSASRPDHRRPAGFDRRGFLFSLLGAIAYARCDSGLSRVLQRSRGPAPLAGPGDAALPRGEGRGRRGARGPGRGRLPADRELPHRLGHHHLRPAPRGVRRRHAPPDPRDPPPGAPHAHGACRVPRSSGIRRVLSHPVALGQCRDLARGAPARRRAGERLGHGGQRRDRGAGEESRAGRHRRTPRRRRPRPGAAGRADRGRSHQPDPLPHLHPPDAAELPAAQRGRPGTRPRSSCWSTTSPACWR